LKCREKEIMVI